MNSKMLSLNLHKGFLMNILSAFAFYFATYFLKKGISLGDIESQIYVYSRYLLGTFIIGLYLVWKGQFLIPANARKFVLGRAVFNILAVLAFYKSVETGTTGQANVLNMTYPAFIILFSGPVLGEWPKLRTYTYMAIALVGILLNFPIFEKTSSIRFESVLFGLVSALVASFAILSLRGAVTKTSPETVLFWMFLNGAVVMTPFVYDILQDFPQNQIIFLVLSSFSGVAGQWLLSRSYLNIEASTGSIISSSRIPIALFFGWFLLSERFTLYTFWGAVLIFLANVLLAVHSNKQKLVKQDPL